MNEIIGMGAEATLYKAEDHVIKQRHVKEYRLKEIDDTLRKARTKREAKVMEKLDALGFPAPKLRRCCTKEMKIEMSLIDGNKVRDVFESDYEELSREIGKKVAILHNNSIIHSDLTTSNMILGDEIHLIDFGLSFFSDKAEDKAVDLHLLRCALESKHYSVYEKAYALVLESYLENCTDGKIVLNRLEKVEERGRNKSRC